MLNIRKATPEDVSLIKLFIRALAEYEREPQAAVATEEDLLRDGFGAEPKYRCLIAEWDGAPAGFAFYFYNYSTWQGRPGLYLEDLFVKPEFREVVRLVRRGLLHRTHLVEIDLEPSARTLPRRFGSGQSSANDLDFQSTTPVMLSVGAVARAGFETPCV